MSEPSSDPNVRPRFTSVSDFATSKVRQLIAQSYTGVIRGLWRLAPKRRRAKLPWILLGGLVAIGALLAADSSRREFLVGRVTPIVSLSVAKVSSGVAIAPSSAVPAAPPPVAPESGPTKNVSSPTTAAIAPAAPTVVPSGATSAPPSAKPALRPKTTRAAARVGG
jgi:hypothetical protein